MTAMVEGGFKDELNEDELIKLVELPAEKGEDDEIDGDEDAGNGDVECENDAEDGLVSKLLS